MKVNELMVGDWVQHTDPVHNGEKFVIEGLRVLRDVLGGELCLIREKYCETTAIMVKPIPLTVEILERNGFYPDSETSSIRHSGCTVYTMYEDNGDSVVSIDFKDGRFGLTEVYGCNGVMTRKYIKYVHELQHALRLCGFKKEIEL